MTDAGDAPTLVELLRIEPAGEDCFRTRLPGFGGVTLGCAALAAARTTEQALASLHVYFLRAVPTQEPALLRVTRVRDGRSFAHRRVEVCEGERVCCELVACFAAPAEGPAFQEPQDGPPAPPPEDLPDEAALTPAERQARPMAGTLEWRYVGGAPAQPSPASCYQGWTRPRTPLPKERALHAGALAFLADMHSHLPAARRLGGPFEPFGYTSLDQVLWQHVEEPWDDWRLVTTVCDVASGGRAFTRRTVRARDGRLLASMAQEQRLPQAAS
jgi:acyl-CoA thioesterase-2